ncbi:GNAT family N-acetyltransferase [Salisediminibacterium halotolerans]|uniref:Protein N-acetyltransferase, RimJ/RimL family n=1 Tax=Salisediminibacterium halotolerans TaxID=517425 RepID=A0A1H9TN18_9BACI|nr:GNAT family N-acetyltransferase [Salisediminibacterium haloalkalitolerans]SER98555.1 Protein N-acetyltransferase, RimJ/RimL family [Salisediminibacterium haloalkalitolerans]
MQHAKKVIETDRLYLREFITADADSLAQVLSDPESMKYYPEPFSYEKVERWIQQNIRSYEMNNHGLWAVILKENGRLIGDCGITLQEIDGKVLPEIGYHIIKDYWNNGYASEAAQACLEYAFTVLRLSSVYSYMQEKNIPSQKVAAKIGMQFCKQFEKNNVRQILYAYRNPKAL